MKLKNNNNIQKAPGFDLVTGEMVKQLFKKAKLKLTFLISDQFRLKYVPLRYEKKRRSY